MKKIVAFLLIYLIWLILCWAPDTSQVVAGFFVALLVTYLTGHLFYEWPHTFTGLFKFWRLGFVYVPVLVWQCVKANLDVAYRVLHPALPIRPSIMKVTTTLKSEVALTILANSITLTPGTMCVDVDKDNGVLYVHWIDTKTTDSQEATSMIVERFESILKQMFE